MNSIKKKIYEDLEKMNIDTDDTLLIHSSYKSLGGSSPSAKEFLEILVNYLSKGTLLFPALSYEFVLPKNPCFDNRKTASCVGYLPEVFRTQFDVVRSNHPTHSVCATGKEAVSITHLHEMDETPCGNNSPFTLLPKYNGKILMIGCGLKPNTFMHSVEEFVKPGYLFGERVKYSIIDDRGHYREKEYFTHGFKGYAQRYDKVINLNDSGWIIEGKILDAKCHLLDSNKLRELSIKKMKVNKNYFVEKIENKA